MQDDIYTREQSAARELQQIVNKKQYCNSLLPVFKLPADLLARIFLSIVRCDFEPLSRRSIDHHTHGSTWRTTLTHVCHHWREVCLDNYGIIPIVVVRAHG